MKISVIVRTYNEQENLPLFIDSYIDWVDHILISDDWSENVEYLFDLPKKVWVSFYTGTRIEREQITRAKQHTQLNGLIRWAEHIGSDWIIMDDCDSIPNVHLIQNGKEIMKSCEKDFIYAIRLYLYKNDGWFPKLSKPNGEWAHGIWAWKANKEFRFIDNDDGPQKFDRPDEDNILKLDCPYALIHSPWKNDQVIAEKRFRYTQIYGKEYSNFDPIKIGGALQPLPEWVNK